MNINLEEMKARYSIFDVISKIGITIASTNGTRVIRCVSGLHEDKHPSLVVMPEVNRVECKSCGFKGDIFELIMKTQGISTLKEAALWLDPSLETNTKPSVKPAYIAPEKYLASRGITEATALKFGLKIGKEYNKDCLIIPLPTGEKYRFINVGEKDTRFATKPGTKACLFTAGNFKDAKKVIGYEGELDAILAYQMTGYPCFSSSAGAETFLPEWKELFKGKDVCFAYDNDSAGKNGAKKAAEIIGLDSCKYASIPQEVGKDVTDFFKFGHTKEDFDELLREAKPYKVTFAERFSKASESGIVKIPTGIKQVDNIIGGLRLGNTYQLAGLKKSGKTSFLLMMANNLLNNNVKVGYIDTELGAQELCNRLAAIYNNKTIAEVEENQELANEWAEVFSSNFFYSSIEDEELLEDGVISTDKFLEKMQDNIRAGCKVLIFDNLTTLTLLQIKGRSGWEIVSTFISQLIQLAKQNRVTILYVIHTKEGVIYTDTPDGIKNLIEQDKAEEIFKESITVNRKPTALDILGGSAAHSQLGGTFLLWRPYQDLKLSKIQEMTEVILSDFRHAPSGDPILLSFQGDRGTFTEALQEPQATAPVSYAPAIETTIEPARSTTELTPDEKLTNEYSFERII